MLFVGVDCRGEGGREHIHIPIYMGIAAPAVAARRDSTAQLTSAPFVTLSGQQTWEQLLTCPAQGHSWA